MGRLTVAATAAALAVTACSGEQPGATDPVQRSNGTTALVAKSRPSAVMEAEVVGLLVRTDAGCLALENGGAVDVLQLPFGSMLVEDGRAVVVAGLGTVALGEQIDGGGGYLELGDVPSECRAGSEIAIWQTI